MDEQLTEDNVTESEQITYSVDVAMMNLEWMKRDKKTFLDLVKILSETKNKAVFETDFVKNLLDQYWDAH